MENPLFGTRIPPVYTTDLEKAFDPDGFVLDKPKVISVFSGTGGVGKTLLAVNLAKWIQMNVRFKQKPAKVLVLDGDLHGPGIGIRLRAVASNDLLDMVKHIDEQKDQGKTISEILTSFEPSNNTSCMKYFIDHYHGIDYLSSDTDVDGVFEYEPKDLEEVLEICKRFYDVVIIDAGSNVSSLLMQTWIANSDKNIVMPLAEVDSLYQNTKAVRFLCRAQQNPTTSNIKATAKSDSFEIVMSKIDEKQVIINFTMDAKAVALTNFAWAKDAYVLPDVGYEASVSINHASLLDNAEYQEALKAIAKGILG